MLFITWSSLKDGAQNWIGSEKTENVLGQLFFDLLNFAHLILP